MCSLMEKVDDAKEMLTSSNSTWTIFAPSSGFLSHFLVGVKFPVEDLFWFHAAKDQKIFKKDLSCDNFNDKNSIKMSNGNNSRTLCDKGVIEQTGDGNDSPVPFVSFDMIACNGIIHTISDILLDS